MFGADPEECDQGLHHLHDKIPGKDAELSMPHDARRASNHDSMLLSW